MNLVNNGENEDRNRVRRGGWGWDGGSCVGGAGLPLERCSLLDGSRSRGDAPQSRESREPQGGRGRQEYVLKGQEAEPVGDLGWEPRQAGNQCFKVKAMVSIFTHS